MTVIIILSIAIGVSYTIAIPQYLEIRKEATWAYQESIKLKIERTEAKDASPVDEKVSDAGDPSPSVGVSGLATSAPPASMEDLIKKYFKDDYETAIAVFTAESKLQPSAQGFNCRYGGISQVCKKGDEDKAWSTDCGIAQINVPGRLCPDELFDPQNNLDIAYGKFQKRGWSPWSAYRFGKYLEFL